jgi:hypothetical protein
MAKNPYDTNNVPGKFGIVFAGLDTDARTGQDYFCFRINLTDHPGIDGCMFEMEVSDWLFGETTDQWFMGNGFDSDPDYPKLTLRNRADHGDTFLAFASEIDVVLFQERFRVRGYTPLAAA